MAPSRAPSAQLLHSLRSLTIEKPHSGIQFRRLTTSSAKHQDAAQVEKSSTSYYRNPQPETVYAPRLERKLLRAGIRPIGSRRRRAAIANSPGVPFDQLPFQCFQEARKILIADREEKLQQIETEKARIARLSEVDPNTFPGGDAYKQRRLRSMHTQLEKLKILADINDPNVKKRFEDGKGDMNKPIYRHLARKKWEAYPRKVLVQRITQLKVVPDVVPSLDPDVDVKISFGKRSVPPGEFVDAAISERAPQLNLQMFEKGEKLVTIAVVDPDIPNLETNAFDSRCYYLAFNIPLSASQPFVDLGKLSPDSQVLLPWIPPYAQKGSPYHRLSIVVLQQKDNIPVDLEVAAKKAERDGFSVRNLMSRHLLTPITASLFRAIWDDTTAGVMQRAGIEGSDVELKRKKVEPLPYKRRNPSTFR
ncbi:hypothetical protein PV10_04672 [Exophiala mesophila]|uniref:Large ribosomal subunit protein mL38 n=1 Tax=Exophiala mesophila TaxID=212818 RepID=A0A0D1WVR4_EXOME|nr:uncharacterized protein PV10_04672 [Exophiala mesophila]KIV93460.1 hypothetical protein PV10_04672 [Exophiala mesophila]